MSIKGFEVGGVQQRYDYTALDNTPANLVQDANYVHTDNNFTNADKTKLDGIEANANKTVIDATLTQSGQAADAKATGDELDDLKSAFTANLIHDTATGSIANFPDGAALPVRDLSVDIEPVQDLNGYDNPWPAGGGKNKIDANTVWAAFLQSDGTFYHPLGNVHWQIPSALVGQQLTFSAYAKADANNANLRVCAVINGTNNNGNLINNTTAFSLTQVTFTPASTSDYIRLENSGINGTYKEIQIEVGSTATAYSPYSNICPISGWTGAKVTRTVANILPVDFEVGSLNAINGEPAYNTSYKRSANFVPITPSTKYYVKSSAGIFIKYYDENKTGISTTWGAQNVSNAEITTASNAKYMKVVFPVDMDISDFCINCPSTATAYEPYQGETYSITFPAEAGTVYGGTLDVTTGKLTVGYARYKFTGTEPNYAQVASNRVAIKTAIVWKSSLTGWCSDFKFYATAATNFIYLETAMPAADVKTYMANHDVYAVCELATPIVYDLTPTEVSTLLGTNNVWADTGDSTVDYYADPTLYINRKIAAAVAALS